MEIKYKKHIEFARKNIHIDCCEKFCQLVSFYSICSDMCVIGEIQSTAIEIERLMKSCK
jgi:hypothetical protein